MITELYYFNGLNSSKIGLSRALITFPFLFVYAYVVLLKNTNNNTNKRLLGGSLVIALFLCSVMGVQNPSSMKESVVYCALIMGVIYSCIIVSNNTYYDNIIGSVLVFLSSITLGAILGLVLWKFGPIFS